MIDAVIIDDEKAAITGLTLSIQKYCPQVRIIASFQDPEKALANMNSLKPDLVFLDIQMPKLSGFDLLQKLPTINFEVIFVTSYDRYAIKAIKFSALDYLLKPIDVDDLISAIDRIGPRHHQMTSKYQALLSNLKEFPEKLTRLAIPTDHEILLQELSEIIYFEASGSYSVIHLINHKSIIVSRTLKDFEHILPSTNFYRIHHSTLVNVNHVVKYVRGEGGYVVLTGGEHLDVSRRKKEGFLKVLNRI